MNWRERTIVAETDGFTDQDKDDASSWLKCAVGEQQRLHPELVWWYGDPAAEYLDDCYAFGPADAMLLTAGCLFMEAVDENDTKKAHHSLDMIEGRMLALKRKAGSK